MCFVVICLLMYDCTSVYIIVNQKEIELFCRLGVLRTFYGNASMVCVL